MESREGEGAQKCVDPTRSRCRNPSPFTAAVKTMAMSPPPRDYKPPLDMRHRTELSEATIREMQRGAEAIGREYQDSDATRNVRMDAIRKWQREGKLRHIPPTNASLATPKTLDDANLAMMDTVVVGDEYFSELTVEFPSEGLFARVGLAVNFGGHPLQRFGTWNEDNTVYTPPTWDVEISGAIWNDNGVLKVSDG